MKNTIILLIVSIICFATGISNLLAITSLDLGTRLLISMLFSIGIGIIVYLLIRKE